MADLEKNQGEPELPSTLPSKNHTQWLNWLQRNAIPLFLFFVAFLGIILTIVMALEPCSVVIIPGKITPAALILTANQSVTQTTVTKVNKVTTQVSTPANVDVVVLLDKSGSLVDRGLCTSPNGGEASRQDLDDSFNCWYDVTEASTSLLTELSKPGSPLTNKRTITTTEITGQEVHVTTTTETAQSYYLPSGGTNYTSAQFRALVEADGRKPNVTETGKPVQSTKVVTQPPEEKTSQKDEPVDSLRAAVISWNHDAKMEFPLKDELSVVTAGVGKIAVPEPGWTYYALALSQCLLELEENGRAGAKKVCILESDGAPTDNFSDSFGSTQEPYEEGSLSFEAGAPKVLAFCQARNISPCTGLKVAEYLKAQDVLIIGLFIESSANAANDAAEDTMLTYLSCEGKTKRNCDNFLTSDLAKLQEAADRLSQLLVTVGAPTVGQPESQPPSESTSESTSEPVTSDQAAVIGANVTLPSQESCINDPNVWWVLLLFLPLLAYMFFRPISLIFAKQRMTKMRKETLRNSTTLEELDAAMDKMNAANAPKQRRYKWSIAAADSYLWNMGGGGATPMPVNFGAKAPPSAPKKDASKFMYKRNPMAWEAPTKHDHYEPMEMQPGDFDYEYTVFLMRCFSCACCRSRDGQSIFVRCLPCCFKPQTRFDEMDAGEGSGEKPQIQMQSSQQFEIPSVSSFRSTKGPEKMPSSKHISLT